MYCQKVKCGSCNRVIDLSSGINIYRTCDNYVCSKKCSNLLLTNISREDPQFENPDIWTNKTIIKNTCVLDINERDYEYPHELTFEPVINEIIPIIETNDEEKKINSSWNYKGAVSLVCGAIILTLMSL